MDFKNNLPIYTQIVNSIKKKIVSGEIGEGDKLSSVREFSTEIKVNPNTIQRAYKELESEGIAFTKRGMGTFITEEEDVLENMKKDMAANMVEDFMSEMKSIGLDFKDVIELLEQKKEEE